ncbi:fimbrial biogenesis chaperone [Pseudomonas sp. UBA2684]|uniref:fimbrial biogenesis chaperone n=1 Tax=Pseudomonas sp. UBA2684 TaxID=1947311 RepID=UPI000E964C91|nr:molecular chaperone [Pseudomonas sp. UBA2684]HBX54154.1 molecular chaperone [Pseudomonas sp.]|tara:strand:+ start:1196 stop:1894 length:699 start_codon:yes stop_codon:yes gene_type:complete
MRLKVAAFLVLAVGFWLPQVQAGVNVGSTRVIYQGKEKEANLALANSGDDGVPYLVQSWVSPFDNRDDSADEFIITPPLFRLDANSQNILRIIATNTQNLPADQESLFLLNVKAIPAMSDEQRNQNVLQIALKTTIKLFYRPASLKGSLIDAVEKLQWRVADGKLSVHNPSGFNVVVSELLINNIASQDVPEVIKPGSTVTTHTSLNNSDTLVLSYINEYGSTVKAAPVPPH